MCSLEDILNLPVSLRPTLVTLVVVLALQERAAHVLASQETKDVLICRCRRMQLQSTTFRPASTSMESMFTSPSR